MRSIRLCDKGQKVAVQDCRWKTSPPKIDALALTVFEDHHEDELEGSSEDTSEHVRGKIGICK